MLFFSISLGLYCGSVSFSLSVILKSIVSHCHSSIQCHTLSAEDQAQEGEQEGTSLFQLSQTPRLFSSPLSLSVPFPSHLLLLGLQRPTTLRDARALPFSRRIPDTFSLLTLVTGVASTLFLAWRVLRLLLSSWLILVLQQLLKDLVLGNPSISQDNLIQVFMGSKT